MSDYLKELFDSTARGFEAPPGDVEEVERLGRRRRTGRAIAGMGVAALVLVMGFVGYGYVTKGVEYHQVTAPRTSDQVLFAFSEAGGYEGFSHQLVVTEGGVARVSEGEGAGRRTVSFEMTAKKMRELRALFEHAPWPPGRTSFLPPDGVSVADGINFDVSYQGVRVQGELSYPAPWLSIILDELEKLTDAHLPSSQHGKSSDPTCTTEIDGRGLRLEEHYPPKPYFEAFNTWRTRVTGHQGCLTITAGQQESNVSEGVDDPTRYEPNGWLWISGDYRHDRDGIGTRKVPLPRPVRVVLSSGSGYSSVLLLQSLNGCQTIAYNVRTGKFEPDMFHTIVPCPKGARPDQYARYFFESTQPVVGGILELDADRDSVCLTLTGTTFEVARLKLHGESLVEFKNRDRRKSDGAICLRRDVESMLIDIAARTDPPYLEFSGGSLAGSRAKLRKQ